MNIKDIVGFDEVFEAVCDEWTELRLNVRKVDGQIIASIGAHNELAIKTAPRDQSAGSIIRDAIQDLLDKVQANDNAVVEEPVTIDPQPWTGGPVAEAATVEVGLTEGLSADEALEQHLEVDRQIRARQSQIEILSNRLSTGGPDRFEQIMGELRVHSSTLENLVEERGRLQEMIRDLMSGTEDL